LDNKVFNGLKYFCYSHGISCSTVTLKIDNISADRPPLILRCCNDSRNVHRCIWATTKISSPDTSKYMVF